MQTEEEFWARVDKHGDEDACWDILDKRGRVIGSLRVNWQGKWVRGHRLAYSFVKGPIPDGKGLSHFDDGEPCVNPAHLVARTRREVLSAALQRRGPGEIKGRHFEPSKLTKAEAMAARDYARAHLDERGIAEPGILSQIARHFDMASSSTWNMLYGLTYKDVPGALSRPAKASGPPGKVIAFGGEEHTGRGWEAKTGIAWQTLYHRMYVLGWPVEKALTTPVRPRRQTGGSHATT